MGSDSPYLLAAVSLLSALQMGELNTSAYLHTCSGQGVAKFFSHIPHCEFLGQTCSRNCNTVTVDMTVDSLKHVFHLHPVHWITEQVNEIEILALKMVV